VIDFDFVNAVFVIYFGESSVLLNTRIVLR